MNGCAVKAAGPTRHRALGGPTGDEPQPEERVGRHPGGLPLAAGTLTLLFFPRGGWLFLRRKGSQNTINSINSINFL